MKKVQAIEICPLPQTKTSESWLFHGMSCWYRRLVPTFSARTAILTDLTKRTCLNKVQWKKEAETAFKDVNEALSKQLVLYSPDFDNTFTMQTDASECCAGADIQGEPGDCHPIAYISCSRERLCFRQWRRSAWQSSWLWIHLVSISLEFSLETDHQALQWMDRMKDSNALITHWYLSAQPYRFTISQVPGQGQCHG